jgi:hypothetical protein
VLLDELERAANGDRIDISMFYLSVRNAGQPTSKPSYAGFAPYRFLDAGCHPRSLAVAESAGCDAPPSGSLLVRYGELPDPRLGYHRRETWRGREPIGPSRGLIV